jgi:hypothetical protein
MMIGRTMRNWLALGALSLGWCVALNSQSMNTAEPAAVYGGHQKRGGLVMGMRMDTNVIAVITHTNGVAIALHFTQISGTNVTYSWRSRSWSSEKVLEGQSSFTEPYRPPPLPGIRGITVFPGLTNLLSFPAGGLQIVLQPVPNDRERRPDPRSVILLYTTDRAKITLVESGEPFETLPRKRTAPDQPADQSRSEPEVERRE